MLVSGSRFQFQLISLVLQIKFFRMKMQRGHDIGTEKSAQPK